MNPNDVLELVRAGFTKEEIMAMQPKAAIKEEPKAAPKAEPKEDPAPQGEPEEPKAAPKAEPQPDIMAQITKLIDDKFSAFDNQLNEKLKNANLFSIPDVESTTDIKDIITNFFKEE